MSHVNKTLATTAVARTEAWWQQRHQQKLAEKRALDNDVDLLFLGDSITHSWEDTGLAVWNKYYANLKPFNLGYSGDRTEHLLWRLQNGEIDGLSPKLIVLLIGTNNAGHRVESAEDTAAGVEAILQTLRSSLAASKILLLATFPRSKSLKAPMRKRVNAANKLCERLADQQYIFWLDIGQHFLTDDGTVLDTVMPDFLHLAPAQYQVWAEAMQQQIHDLMEYK
ncbi:platelet-activating factor acetylhydrolase IB subunit [Paraglaciecola aquimarina]|uniref:Platelet-activating factor acetylhydrolase IB subunit n=1 Tax=Paraglaciecola aquimarina TaxID=1235557 RepID=A0ABU3SWR5_9ALTE|nr:platelet-activating factor acetylhydrolase IB subunit [Paraglaciecola aquimarina]MDU0354457.1 platelet-activating factor acetylhydrolase IB subunit [Paraglaciecola aquimarina]